MRMRRIAKAGSHPRLARIAGACVMSILAGCASDSLSLAPASPQDPAPQSTEEPAAAARTSGREFTLPANDAMPIVVPSADIDAKRVYGLPELIDIAQTRNPVTRAAWDRARQAALAVGMARATYLPAISADAIVGYQYTSQTNPGVDISSTGAPALNISLGGSQNIIPRTISTRAREFVPAVTAKWLLFDFGGRAATVAAANELSIAANAGFTAAHQKLIYDVAIAYYQLSAARAQLAIARETRVNANVIHDAARSRLGRGIATTIEVAQARQQAAQAQLAVVQSEGIALDAYRSLLRAMGVSPTTQMQVADSSGRPLPRAISGDLDRLVEEALRRRPDVAAAFARMKADRHNVDRAQSDLLPRVALTASGSRNIGVVDVRDNLLGLDTRARVNAPNLNVMLGVTMPLYDGGLRDAQVKSAQAQADAAEQEFAQIQNDGARQIVVAYDTLRTSLAVHAAASELTSAAGVTAAAARDYYKQGLGTFTDVAAAQNGLLQARVAKAKAHADALSAAATIAFATGAIAGRTPQ